MENKENMITCLISSFFFFCFEFSVFCVLRGFQNFFLKKKSQTYSHVFLILRVFEKKKNSFNKHEPNNPFKFLNFF